MRILHVMLTMAEAYGGPVAACKIYAEGQIELGHEVKVYATNIDFPVGFVPSKKRDEITSKQPYVEIFPAVERRYGFSLPLFFALLREVKSVDVVHIHGLYRFPNMIAGLLAHFFKVPYVIRPHGSLDPYLFHQKKNKLFKRMAEKFVEFPIMNRASAIHFSTQDELRLVQRLGLKSKHCIIPNGMRSNIYFSQSKRDSFRMKNGIKNQTVILHFGRITQKKGLDVLIEACFLLKNSGESVILYIVGPDNDNFKKNVLRWIKKFHLEEITRFLGMVTDDDVIEVLSGSDIFCLPSYTENFGMAVIEAMAANLPVVISDAVNIQQEVLNHTAGLVVPVGDARATADAIKTIIDDNDLKITLRTNAKKMVESMYTRRSVSTRTLGLYREITHSDVFRA